jgi:hypothetical protein
MEELHRAPWAGRVDRSGDGLTEGLAGRERWIRISVLVAFVAMLALEAWLLWQVWLLF